MIAGLEGIVARIVIPETPVRVEYELTTKGRALERSLSEIGRWAERWLSETPPDASDPDPRSQDHRSAKATRRAAEASPRAHR